ncbi:hypothetical protein BEN47_01690 [Hymenobacter lapidarius]|uniref:SHSP domain-containing protein n=2 Tax=Hymenobacter lapidarius TaxID=1908237 RepID=A0A1G1T607_9BACT|nr:hypothetical protein BEN47_01690 [Hymenobacter lapidarius]
MLAGMLRDPQAASAPAAPAFTPAADILETAEGFELHVALPGVRRESVNIEFLEGQLVVSGTRPNPAQPAEAAAPADDQQPAPATPEASAAPQFRRLETNYGDFTRSFRLPDTVNATAIGAELTDGILRLMLPFDTAKVTRHRIEIR